MELIVVIYFITWMDLFYSKYTHYLYKYMNKLLAIAKECILLNMDWALVSQEMKLPRNGTSNEEFIIMIYFFFFKFFIYPDIK